MLALTLGEVAEIVGGTLDQASPAALVTAPSVVDNRLAQPGGLFAAFVGEHVDGHRFAEAAIEAGAVAVLGSRPTGQPTVVVADVAAALQDLAREVLARLRRSNPALRVIAVTGSQGKTSTKDLIAAVLSGAGETVATAGSFNNEIGLPLTVLRASRSTRYLVLEMGARGIGHVAELCAIAPPDVSLVLNVGVAHLGEFGSQEAIATAKGELVEAARSAAVLNLDDPRVAAMATRTRAEVVTFGQGRQADVAWADLVLDDLGRARFALIVGGSSRQVQLRLIGAQHAANAAAAIAVGISLGLPLDQVITSIEQVGAISKWRMELSEPVPGFRIINDSYNANPDSMAAALHTLAEIGARAGVRTIAVLGEMRELGQASRAEHERIGQLTRDLGIDTVVVVGEAADPIAAMCESPRRAASIDDAVEAVRKDVGRGPAIVLVKASRGAALERVVDGLAESLRDDQEGQVQ